MQKNTNCPHCGEDLKENMYCELTTTQHITFDITETGKIQIRNITDDECLYLPDWDEGPYKCASCDKNINDFVHDELLD